LFTPLIVALLFSLMPFHTLRQRHAISPAMPYFFAADFRHAAFDYAAHFHSFIFPSDIFASLSS